MKGSYSALLAVGAGVAGAMAVWMTTPPPVPDLPPQQVATVRPATPPVVVPEPVKPSPAPVAIPEPPPEVTSAPPPVYSEPPHSDRPAPVLKAKLPAPPTAPPAEKPAVTPPPTPVPYQEPTPRKAADPEPAAPPPEPSARQAILERGQDVPVRVLQTLSAENVHVGDIFHGELAEPVVANGFVVGERGAPVKGRVVEVQRGRFFGGGATITLRLLNFLTADGQYVEVSTEPWTVKGVSGDSVIHFRMAARIAITERRL